MLSVNEIRKTFVEYFQSKGHLKQASASLLPYNDASLLFTTAGMVPFKPYFAGSEVPPSKRLVSIQKCIRTTDLESVGKTKRHLSFFEMLGNFSFGDYFKKEAIEFSWELSTNFLKFNKERIWVTIYQDDDEAFDLWKNHIGFDEKKIVRLGKKDNFWGPAGTAGACGPCSELYLDRGIEFATSADDIAPGSDGDRFMEFWNLVFNQFNKTESGEYLPLAQTGIDTGAGVERLATLLQEVDSVYDIDEFQTLRETISTVYNKPYSGDNIVPIRVLCDHVRSLTFAMSDGIYPSNESRGYVLRRMLRRAMLFGRKIGQDQPLLYKIVPVIEKIYHEFYPELTQHLSLIEDYIRTEEERFLSTLHSGSEKLEDLLDKAAHSHDKIVSGKDVFLLYDTFGFPPEMTAEMAENKNLQVDMAGFHKAMEEQKERGRKAWKGSSERLSLEATLTSAFSGYEREADEGVILAIFADNQKVESISSGTQASLKTITVITDKTPFYGESGGQLGDAGTIRSDSGWLAVDDTQKLAQAVLHIGQEVNGSLRVGQKVSLQIDSERRRRLRVHHSATHLLNASLGNHLGPHIKQSGSLVADSYLRFDFTHPKALTPEQLEAVENEINDNIAAQLGVATAVLPIEEAKNRGAVMTFGEKYGDIVRVVEMGNASKEFCGGTHVGNTSEIKLFFVVKESSPGAGNRRIEAVAEQAALAYIDQLKQKIRSLFDEALRTQQNGESSIESLNGEFDKLDAIYKQLAELKPSVELYRRLKTLLRHSEELYGEFKKLLKKKSATEAKSSDDLLSALGKADKQEFSFQKTEAVAYHIAELPMNDLKNLADKLREENPQKIYLLLSSSLGEKRWNLVAAMTKKLSEQSQVNLGKKVKDYFSSNKQYNGGGGGKNELAQASGTLNSDEFESQIKLLQLELKNILYQN